VLHKTLIALATAAALGCVPVATNALASSHPGNHASARHAAGAMATPVAVMLPATGVATAMDSTMDRSMTAALATAPVMATATVDARATVVLSAG
jgi:hypothetical protein